MWGIDAWSRKWAETRETCSLLSIRPRVPADHHDPKDVAQYGELLFTVTPPQHSPSKTTTSSKRQICQKTKFRAMWAIILHRKAGSGNEYSRTTTSIQVGLVSLEGLGSRNKHSSKTITTVVRGWSCKNRPGGAKQKTSKTTSSIQREHPCQYGHG